MNSAICRIVPLRSDLCRLRAHAAMCAFGIDKLRQHPAEILLLRRHAEQNTLGSHVPVKSLDIGDRETQFDFSSRILVGSGMQSEGGFTRRELAPTRRLEFQLQTKHIAMELRSFVHIGDKLDHVSQLCLHLCLPPNSVFSS